MSYKSGECNIAAVRYGIAAKLFAALPNGTPDERECLERVSECEALIRHLAAERRGG